MRDALAVIAFALAAAALLVLVLIRVRGSGLAGRIPALGKPRAKGYVVTVAAVALLAGGVVLSRYPQREASTKLDGYGPPSPAPEVALGLT